MKDFNGKSLQLLRLRQGLKSKDVALALGVSPSYYSEIERGRKPVPTSSEFIRKLAALFGFHTLLERVGDGAEQEGGHTAAQQKELIDLLPALFLQSLGSLDDRPELPSDRDSYWDEIKKNWPKLLQEVQRQEAEEEAKVLEETDSSFVKRVADLERAALYYFHDAAEVFKMASTKPNHVLLKGMGKSLGQIQPLFEKEFSRILKEVRILRRLARAKR
jgi:transcriptional regulator with XRE-family HTH domain